MTDMRKRLRRFHVHLRWWWFRRTQAWPFMRKSTHLRALRFLDHYYGSIYKRGYRHGLTKGQENE